MRTKEKTKGFFIVKVVLGIASALSFIWFLLPLFWGVKNIGNLLGMLVSIFVISYLVMITKLTKKGYHKIVKILNPIVISLGALGAAWVAFLSGCMIYGASSTPPKGATVVVLGCQVKGTKPSKHLKLRIEAAANYLKENPEVNCVASGGQGNGESLSEAQVISDYLVDLGVEPERIVLEDRSTNTKENLENSLEIIQEKNWSEELAIVTDEYHQFRAGMIANKLGAKSYAVPAHSHWYTFSANYARELLAITKEFFVH